MAYQGERDQPSATYTVTNYSESLSLSGTESTAADIALVLTNVIRDLINKGILNGSVA